METKTVTEINLSGPCPFCLGPQKIRASEGLWNVLCLDCEARGPAGKTLDEARYNWKRMTNHGTHPEKFVFKGVDYTWHQFNVLDLAQGLHEYSTGSNEPGPTDRPDQLFEAFLRWRIEMWIPDHYAFDSAVKTLILIALDEYDHSYLKKGT